MKENYNNIKCFLEMFFMRFRGETIRFATNFKKTQTQQEKALLADIRHLENSASSTNLSLLEDKKMSLKILEISKLKAL